MAGSGFGITFVFKGDASYRSAFEKAAGQWEKIIVEGLPNVGKTDDLSITVSITPIDGEGGVLGQAGPTHLRNDSGLPYKGIMRFDASDVSAMRADGTLIAVIAHEIGHVLGIGPLWGLDDFDFIDRAHAGYTGEHALAAYRQLSGDPAAPFIPLETEGGEGTAFSHWSESVFDEEIMTGYADREMPVSAMTVGALQDLGYTVSHAYADAFVI